MENENINLGDTYEIVRQIGSGGGGTVYLAYHNRLQKNVVIKKVRDGVKLDYRMETDILKNLHHEYLPQVFDFIQNETGIYTVMDFIPGKSLGDLIKEGRTFTPNQVYKYACQLCDAVDYLHTRKIPVIHGDIKPDNIMLTPDDNICLIDFNISGFSDNLNLAGFTRGYAAPEQCMAIEEARRRHKAQQQQTVNVSLQAAATDDSAQIDDVTQLDDTTQLDGATAIDDGAALNDNTAIDNSTAIDDGNTKKTLTVTSTVNDQPDSAPILVDARADIFAVGATLYHLLVGRKPESDCEKTIPVSKTGIQVSEGLAYVIDKAMRPLPEKRFQTAAEMRKALGAVAKKDKRYRHLLFVQDFISILCLLAAAACVLTAVMGYRRTLTEKTDDLYNTALTYYENGDYENAYNYIVGTALNDKEQYSTSELANLYYMAAECCFELEQYDTAAKLYASSLEIQDGDSSIYCNYAIALAYSGNSAEAEEILKKAVDAGAGDEYIYLVSGELALTAEAYNEAINYFAQSIELTDDSYCLSRAYIKYSECYINQKNYAESEELIRANLAILKQADGRVSDSYSVIIYQRIAEADSLLASLTSDSSYYDEAAAYLNKIIDLGWATYSVYMNLALMYGADERYDESFATYDEVIKQYGESYQPYKNMALLEAQRQSGFENDSRDYSDFNEYYTKAKELFATSGVAGDMDMDMQRLEQIYISLKDLGWLNQN